MIGNPFQLADRIRAKTFVPNLANIDIWKFSFNCFELVHVSLPFDAVQGNKRTSMLFPFLPIMLGHLAAPYVRTMSRSGKRFFRRIAFLSTRNGAVLCPAAAAPHSVTPLNVGTETKKIPKARSFHQ